MRRLSAPARGAACLLLALAVSGCVQRVYPDGPPLREPTTAEDRAFLTCVRVDPLFLTTRCKAARDNLSDDPTPGRFGR